MTKPDAGPSGRLLYRWLRSASRGTTPSHTEALAAWPGLKGSRVPDGERIYAFGDVHGRADLLQRLLEWIAADISASGSGSTVRIIGLGDFIDRGPETSRTLELLCGPMPPGARFEGIRGNHEDMLLRLLADRKLQDAELWLENGGESTLRSYGLWEHARDGLEALLRAMQQGIPLRHLNLLSALRPSVVAGDFFFTHAGARPGIALDAQSELDLAWIRGGFVDRDAPFEKVVVHGHTPVDRPFVGNWRVNLDVGAVVSERLACLILEGGAHRVLLQTLSGAQYCEETA